MPMMLLDEVREALRQGRPVEITLRLRVLDAATLILLGLGFLWRAGWLDYNTLFVDESVYARVGEAFLVGRDPSNALSYMFGSFFYPAIAAFAMDAGGVVGMRALSVVLSLIAAIYVCLSARRLFGETAGLGGVFLFLFSGSSINLGQHAVYDVLAVALLAASLYYTLVAAHRAQHAARFFVLAGVCFALAVLAKYIAVAMLPALAAYAVVGRLRASGRLDVFSRPGWMLGVGAAVLVLVPYFSMNMPAIQQVFTGQYSSQFMPPEQIAQALLLNLGLSSLLALVGLVLLSRKPGQPPQRLVPAALVLLLALSIFVLPVYHILTSNGRALWKHEVFTLVFLAPVAGLALSRLLRSLWEALERGNLIRWGTIASVLVAGGLLLVGSAWVSNRTFRSSWLNAAPVINHLERYLQLRPEAFVLASAATVYETYLFPDQPDPNGWRDTWGFDYNGVWGEEGMLMAVQDCALDAVILDDFYTPQTTTLLIPVLESAGYVLDFEDEQRLSAGYSNHLSIYVPGATGACAARGT